MRTQKKEDRTLLLVTKGVEEIWADKNTQAWSLVISNERGTRSDSFSTVWNSCFSFLLLL